MLIAFALAQSKVARALRSNIVPCGLILESVGAQNARRFASDNYVVTPQKHLFRAIQELSRRVYRFCPDRCVQATPSGDRL